MTSTLDTKANVLYEQALTVFECGAQLLEQTEESFNLLLSSIQIDRDWNDQASRKQLLEFFQTLGLNSDEVKVARRQLSAILFS